MVLDPAEQEGWRDRKRRETLRRITEAALGLFVVRGYEATTLDAIAEAAGISRRTFFHYFRSKEEILLAWQSGMPEALRAAVLAQGTARGPFDVLRRALLALPGDFDVDQAVSIDAVLRSTEQLRAGNAAKFLNMEQAAFEALCDLWPEPTFHPRLRMAAMAGVGAMRIAIEAWVRAGGKRPLSAHVEAAFADLEVGLRPTGAGPAAAG